MTSRHYRRTRSYVASVISSRDLKFLSSFLVQRDFIRVSLCLSSDQILAARRISAGIRATAQVAESALIVSSWKLPGFNFCVESIGITFSKVLDLLILFLSDLIVSVIFGLLIDY